MKRFIIVLLLAGLTINYVFSQAYQDYSSDKKQEIFSEGFLDNNNNWRKFYSKVKKGRYIIETIGKDQPAISTIPVQLDKNRNYEIETVVSIEWNRSDEFMGIVWNRDLNNGYYLGFNKDLEIKVFKKENNIKKSITVVEDLGVLAPKYSKNTITIRRIGTEFLIYINKILVYSIPYDAYYGDHIGYFVGSASEIRAYQLTVSYLD